MYAIGTETKLINLTQLLPSYMGANRATDLADKSYKWSTNMNESYRNQDHRMCWRPATLRDLPRFSPSVVLVVVVAPASSPSPLPSLVASAAPCCLFPVALPCLASSCELSFLAATHFHIWSIAATSCAATANSHPQRLRSIHMLPQSAGPGFFCFPVAVCSRRHRRRHCQRRGALNYYNLPVPRVDLTQTEVQHGS